LSAFALKVYKKSDKKIPKKAIRVSKHAEFDADFEFVEKVANKLMLKS
jgi:hypothetical protein